MNTGSEEYINGFLAGQMGKPIPPNASEEWLKAYARGYETSEIESHWSELRENVK